MRKPVAEAGRNCGRVCARCQERNTGARPASGQRPGSSCLFTPSRPSYHLNGVPSPCSRGLSGKREAPDPCGRVRRGDRLGCMPQGADEAKLLEQATGGDRAALAALLEAVGPRVRARIQAKISGPLQASLDADDVMQVTYLEAVLRLNRFQTGGIDGFVAWLTRLADNNLIDAVRSIEAAKRGGAARRVNGMSREESMAAFVEVLGATSTTPSRVAARAEGVRYLEAALSTLPPDYEKVVRMYDLEGRPIGEVAEALGRSEGAVWMLRARAHDRLKDSMGSAGRFFSTPA
jgi:RNA polymerase sigma-70 factor, ECF subfamily